MFSITYRSIVTEMAFSKVEKCRCNNFNIWTHVLRSFLARFHSPLSLHVPSRHTLPSFQVSVASHAPDSSISLQSLTCASRYLSTPAPITPLSLLHATWKVRHAGLLGALRTVNKAFPLSFQPCSMSVSTKTSLVDLGTLYSSDLAGHHFFLRSSEICRQSSKLFHRSFH